MLLKDVISKDLKENVYAFYQIIEAHPKDYDKITRMDIYSEILSCYRKDPEIILQMCSMEEIQILKKLLDEPILKKENGYIDYLLFQNLREHYLVLLEEQKYFIPDDLINYVKMAINLLDEKKYNILDVMDSVILGIARIYNVLLVDSFLEIITTYCKEFEAVNIKEYINSHPRVKDKVEIVRYQKKVYLVSKEYYYYKDVLKLRKSLNKNYYSLEEVLSFGKYKLNLFQEEVLYYLNFLEIHLDSKSIDLLVHDLVFYCGFQINDDAMLLEICDQIGDLYKETKKIVFYFPNWLFFGESENKESQSELESDNFFMKIKNYWNKLFK